MGRVRGSSPDGNCGRDKHGQRHLGPGTCGSVSPALCPHRPFHAGAHSFSRRRPHWVRGPLLRTYRSRAPSPKTRWAPSTPDTSRGSLDDRPLLRLFGVQVDLGGLLRGGHGGDGDEQHRGDVHGDRDPRVEPVQQSDGDDRGQRSAQHARDLVPE
jgi:hypothetical protein